MQRFFILIFTLLIVQVANAQDYEAQQRKLEERKAAILKEINQVKSLLSTEKKKERNILNEIADQNKKIKLTNELISNSQKQQRVISNDIYTNTLESNKLKRELKILKADYAKTIQKSYKARSEQSRILFILSSDNFLQAYKRLQYMKQYAKFRKTQGDEIREKTERLDELTRKMEIQKQKQQSIIIEQQANKQVLEEDKKKQNELMTLVKKDQKLYNQQIRQKQEETKKIDREIKAVIQKAIEEANRKAREKAERERLAREKATGKKETPAKTTGSSSKFEMTPEEKTLANSFRANQGRLPWPVEKGYISLRYGNQPHPSFPDLTIHNSGVEITTESGASVRSVYEGEVMNVQVIAGSRAVFIRHGEYITVYQNLSSVSVKTGQKVSTKQKIGTVTTNGEGKAVLKFVLTQNSTYNNPESWLSGR